MAIHCPACGAILKDGQRCPNCGDPVKPRLAGMLKTSTILISADDTESVYLSVREVPEPLRKKLLHFTNSVNSRTILIADRRGRQEIARALRNLPGGSQRRLSNSLLSGVPPPTPPRLTVAQTVGLLLAGAAGLVAWAILFHR
jgi:hypothetical protein